MKAEAKRKQEKVSLILAKTAQWHIQEALWCQERFYCHINVPTSSVIFHDYQEISWFPMIEIFAQTLTIHIFSVFKSHRNAFNQ